MSDGLIFTNDNCTGCNKCIASCPVMFVNRAVLHDGRYKISVDADSCIHCGKCIESCTHEAREFRDDVDVFFEDLKKGKAISVIAAPSFIANYPDKYGKVMGYLKHLGVRHVYSVSFGADISTWGYLNYIQKHGNFEGYISQPCPVVVDYIEKYLPELIEKLIPVQSPVMCTAIYLKKYLDITDSLALISPCIAKKSEIMRAPNKDLVSYNITFDHLMKRLAAVDISQYKADDELKYGMGAIYPMPGGLKENVQHFLGRSAVVRQIEGELATYEFLQKYLERVKGGKDLPCLVDALNCSRGCLGGTGVRKSNSDIEDVLMHMYSHVQDNPAAVSDSGPWSKNISYSDRFELLNERFRELNPDDFKCEFASHRIIRTAELHPEKLQDAFERMHKYTHEEQNINCGACGYNSCRNMAMAVSEGFNNENNCVYFLKYNLEKEKHLLNDTIDQLQRIKSVLKVKAETDPLTGIYNRSSFKDLTEKVFEGAPVLTSLSPLPLICVLGVLDIDDFKQINDRLGHAAGDEAIIFMARMLRETFRSTDIIARLGGDEFIFLIRDINNKSWAEDFVKRLLIKLSMPSDKVNCKLSVSIGLSIFPQDGQTFDETYQKADIALYQAKRCGKNCYVFYDPAIYE